YFLLNRARAHDSLRDWGQAQADYDQAVALSTSGLRAHFLTQRAEHFIKLGRWRAAADDHAAAAKDTASNTTKSWTFSRDRALTALMAGDLDGYRRSAAELLDRVGDKPSSDQANWLLWVYTAGPGLVTDANYDRLLAATTFSDQYHQDRNRAALPFRKGRFQEAAPLFAKHAGGTEYQFLAAMANAQSGNSAEADRLRNQANAWVDQQQRIDPSRIIPEKQGWQLWSIYKSLQQETTRQFAGPRLAELDAALTSEPDNSPLLAERAAILSKFGQHEQALADLKRAIAAQGGTAELLGVRGCILARLERPEEALADLNGAVEQGATDAVVFAERGRLRWQQGQIGPAQADLENSLQRQPSAVATSTLTDLLLAEASKTVNWTVLKPVDLSTGNSASLTLLEDGSILAGGENRPGESYRLVMKTDRQSIAAIRLEVLTDPSLPRLGPGRGSGGNFSITWKVTAGPAGDDAQPVRIQSAVADYSFARFPITVSSWNVQGGVGAPHVAFLALATPLQDEAGLQFALTIKGPAGGEYGDQNLGRFRVSISDDPRAFAHEQSRLAAGQIADPAARLDAAYRLLGQLDRATENFSRLIDLRRDQGAAPDQLAQAYRLRGAHYTRNSQWNLAAADYAESAALHPKSSSVDWMTAAALWAYAADVDQHRLYCQRMAAQFRESTVANDVERTVKVSLLLEQNAVPDQATIAKFLEAVETTKDPGLLKWFLSAKALLACRNGDFDAAHEAINESLRLLSAGGDAPGSTAGLTARSVQALIFARQGDAARARVALKELQTLLATETKLKWEADGTLDGLTLLSGERAQHDRLIPEILRREAERSLETQARISDHQK
ncbi:MAG TPA: hypothetical protein VM165_15595, partial [Planctomycetaceae bacterium]|nr:hypothetical protein [Planctomycetaceae bacterium]